jgi:hypothetical protein
MSGGKGRESGSSSKANGLYDAMTEYYRNTQSWAKKPKDDYERFVERKKIPWDTDPKEKLSDEWYKEAVYVKTWNFYILSLESSWRQLGD